MTAYSNVLNLAENGSRIVPTGSQIKSLIILKNSILGIFYLIFSPFLGSIRRWIKFNTSHTFRYSRWRLSRTIFNEIFLCLAFLSKGSIHFSSRSLGRKILELTKNHHQKLITNGLTLIILRTKWKFKTHIPHFFIPMRQF